MDDKYALQSAIDEAERCFPGIRDFSRMSVADRSAKIQEVFREHKDSANIKDIIDVYTGVNRAIKASHSHKWKTQDTALSRVRAVTLKRLRSTR